MTNDRKVVITGMGVQSPAGTLVKEHMNAWEKGNTRFNMQFQISPTHEKQIVGRCSEIDKKALPDRKIQKAVMRRDILGVIAATSAIKSAGLNAGDYNPERFAMYVGAGSTQICDLESYFDLLKSSYNPDAFDSDFFGANLMTSVNPMIMLKTLMNNTLCYASIGHDIRGVNANFMDLQASGLRAVGEAYCSILDGRADLAICGGLSGEPDSYHIGEGIEMGYLFDARTCPESAIMHALRPYDVERQGTILSEGAAFVLLEEEEHARARGAAILAQVKGFGLSGDGAFTLLDGKNSQGLRRSLMKAMKQSNCSASDIRWVFGNGNGSLAGDQEELCAYESVWSHASQPVNLVSTKSLVGETTEAGAVISTIMAIEAGRSGKVFPVNNFFRLDDSFCSVQINKETSLNPGELIAIATRSFTGVNCSLVIEPLA